MAKNQNNAPKATAQPQETKEQAPQAEVVEQVTETAAEPQMATMEPQKETLGNAAPKVEVEGVESVTTRSGIAEDLAAKMAAARQSQRSGGRTILAIDEEAEAKLKESVDPVMRSIVDTMVDYVNIMGSNAAPNEATGAGLQVQFINTIRSILRQSDQKAGKTAWDFMVKLVKDHRKGAFAELRVMRWLGSSYMRVSPEDLRMHEKLVNLLLTIADAGYANLESHTRVGELIDELGIINDEEGQNLAGLVRRK